jgi:hypothetical protein
MKRKSLEQHQFFTTMNYWINVEIDNIPVQNRLKRNVVRCFLKIQFTTFYDNFKKLINDSENFKVKNSFENIMIECIKQYEEEALNKGVPSIFLDKFRKWHEIHTTITFDAIRSVCDSKFYDSEYERTAAVLDILLFSFRLTIVDAEKSINELNGQLEQVLKGTIFDV